MPRLTLSSDSQIEGLVQEADRYVNAVALSIVPSARFFEGEQHNREPPRSPTSPVSSSEPQPQPPSTPTLRNGNAESNPPAMQPVRRRKGLHPETPVTPVPSSSEYPYVPAYQQQPSQGTSSSSQTLPSEPQRQPSSTSTTNPQSIRRRKGHPPETPVSPANSSTEYSQYVPPYQPQPNSSSSSSQPFPSEPQQLQPPSPTSTLRGSIDDNPQATKPIRRRKGHPPETPVPPVNSSTEYPQYVPPYQPQPSQGTVHSSSSQTLSSSQQPGVNEGAVNGCALHRGNTVHRNNTSGRHHTSPANTRQPTTSSSSSKSRYHPQDPPSSGGRLPSGDDPSLAGTSHSTIDRFNEWSQSSEHRHSSGDALYSDEPPPSFHDALLAPVVGSRSELSLASTTAGHFSIRHATGKVHSRVFFLLLYIFRI